MVGSQNSSFCFVKLDQTQAICFSVGGEILLEDTLGGIPLPG